MNKIDQIKYEADYIMHGSLTLKEASQKLSEILGKNISLRTLQYHLNKLKSLDHEKYIELQKTIKQNAKRKMSKGGQISTKKTSYNYDLINEIATYIITKKTNHEKVTLKEISLKYQIPISTIHYLLNDEVIIGKEKKAKLKELKLNKRKESKNI